MIRELTRPEISPAFTVNDIHKIREWHYEMLKDATVQERLDFYNNGVTPFQKRDDERPQGGRAAAEPR